MLPTIFNRTPVTRRRTDFPFDFDFDRIFGGMLDTDVASNAFAATDLYETEDAYGLELEVPGFSDDEIEVTVDRGVLTITGRRESETEDESRTYHVRERRSQRFTRSFSLPSSVGGDDVEATLESGVLHVTLPKTPDAKPRRIAVGARK